MTNRQSSETNQSSLSEVLRSQGVDLEEREFTLKHVAEGIAVLFELERKGIFPYDNPE